MSSAECRLSAIIPYASVSSEEIPRRLDRYRGRYRNEVHQNSVPLNRTVVSVPNSSFAGYNALRITQSRDKVLFNPYASQSNALRRRIRCTIRLVESLRQMLAANQLVESVPTPVRVTGLAASALSVEIFCYVRTGNIDEFYNHSG